MQHADRIDAVEKMHPLLEDAEQVGRGEIVAWVGRWRVA
jgi:hypothetical protein